MLSLSPIENILMQFIDINHKLVSKRKKKNLRRISPIDSIKNYKEDLILTINNIDDS
jgi:hypothetical protein